MMKRLLFFVAMLAVLVPLAVVGSLTVSAHTMTQTHNSSVTWTCFDDGCDANFPAGQTCSTASRQQSINMVAHNGTTVGHLYLYYVGSATCGYGAFWGTFVLTSGIQSGDVYSTRGNELGETNEDNVNYDHVYTNPSLGVYHDAPMTGCDNDNPGSSVNQDSFNSAIDWIDAQGNHEHTQSGNFLCGPF